MACISCRAASGESGSVWAKALRPRSWLALRGSNTLSSMRMRWKRASRARSSTLSIFFTAPSVGLSDGVRDLVAGKSGSRRRAQRAGVVQLADGGHRVGVAEQLDVLVVGGPAGGVADPPARLQGDAVGVGEVDRADEAVVDDGRDLAAERPESLLQLD